MQSPMSVEGSMAKLKQEASENCVEDICVSGGLERNEVTRGRGIKVA